MSLKLAITIDQLSVYYNEQLILDSISCSIPQGMIAGIIGPNGAGKSTLIKSMLGFLPKRNGSVKFFGKNLKEFRKKIAYIPQRAEIDWDFPITVFDVVLMGRYPHHSLFSFLTKDDYQKAREALIAISMLEYKDSPINSLSGGQQQRCFLARALCQEAEIYIFDEPFIGIDAVTEKIIMNMLKKLKQEGKTIIMVHHDFSTVTEYFDWVILLNKKLITSGPTAQFFSDHHIMSTYKTKVDNI